MACGGVPMTARTFSHLLRAATRAHDRILEKQLSRAMLTTQQLAVLEAVRDNPDAPNKSIVEITGMDRSTTSELVHRLGARGLLTIGRSEGDGRAHTVRLSFAGKKVMAAAKLSRERADAIISRAVGRRAPELLVMLDKIARVQ